MAIATPQFLQTGTYNASSMRGVISHAGPTQAGVWGTGDYNVTQRVAGATMSVDVASGWAVVNWNNNANYQYLAAEGSGQNVVVPASNSTNPRIDQIVLTINDTTEGFGNGTNGGSLEVVAGTATAGATLDNRSGAAAIGANRIRLADVLVPAASSSVVNSNIRDRRTWARGAFSVKTISNANSTSAWTVGTTETAIAGGLLAARVELSGLAPVTIQFNCPIAEGGGNPMSLYCYLGTTRIREWYQSLPTYTSLNFQSTMVPGVASQYGFATVGSAASHQFNWNNVMASGTGYLYANNPIRFIQAIIREEVRSTTDNT